MIKAGIVGVTGYTGIELLRLLHRHPGVTVTHVVTDSHAGAEMTQLFPHLDAQIQLIGETLNVDTLGKNCDVIFTALPSGPAKALVPELLATGKHVIDLGGDFRATAVYGLPEMPGARDEIASSMLVANPGCYATASILAVMPALMKGIIDPNDCIFDGKSGISGAGKTISSRSHYCEAAENLIPYQLAGTHKHTKEIEHAFHALTDGHYAVQFTPQVIPVIRGISVTAYCKLTMKLHEDEMYEIYDAAYAREPFVRLQHHIPLMKHVRGSQYCDMSLHVDTRTNRLIVISVIDNLMKGASGQAVQNMNIMFKLPETLGLETLNTIYP